MPPRLRSQFLAFPIETQNFLLGQTFETTVFGHLLQRRQAFDGLSNGLVVGQHAAKPAIADVRHFASFCMGTHGVARSALGTDKQHFAAVRNYGLDERISVPSHWQALLKIDDMDLVTFAEDVGCHLRIPVTGLMTKMHASLKHLAHGYVCHDMISGLSLRTPHDTTPFSVGHPVPCVGVRVDCLPQGRALYTIPVATATTPDFRLESRAYRVREELRAEAGVAIAPVSRRAAAAVSAAQTDIVKVS